jgi:hypothetical protein
MKYQLPVDTETNLKLIITCLQKQKQTWSEAVLAYRNLNKPEVEYYLPVETADTKNEVSLIVYSGRAV